MEEPTSASSQGAVRDAHPPSTYKVQLLQVIFDVTEEIAKQQPLFDHKLAFDQENVTRKREELKPLNDQLLTQITTLQNTKGSSSLIDGPTSTEIQDWSTHRSRGHRRTASPTPSEDSMAGQIRLIFIREISIIIFRERLRISFEFKISISLYRSE